MRMGLARERLKMGDKKRTVLLKARIFRFGGSQLISYQFISAAPKEYYKNILIFKGDNI